MNTTTARRAPEPPSSSERVCRIERTSYVVAEGEGRAVMLLPVSGWGLSPWRRSSCCLVRPILMRLA
jgi:hypothetical protein